MGARGVSRQLAELRDLYVADVDQAVRGRWSPVTERTVQAIVADLEAAGYVAHTRVGRRNRHTVHLDRPFRHPAQNGHQVRPLLDALGLPPTGQE